MTTAAIALRRRTFTEIDFLLVSFWLAYTGLQITLYRSPFTLCILAGGAYLIGRHFVDVIVDGYAPEQNLAIAALAPVGFLTFGAAFTGLNHATPVTFDALLARIDCGIAPAFRALVLHNHSVYNLVDAAYIALPLAMLIAVAETHGKERRAFAIALIVGGILAPVWYLILPAVGPIHVGDPNAPRNCMPSMHMTWALLIFTHSKGRGRWLAGIFAVLTAAATIATGEHYTPDLVAALPWTWTLNKLAGKAN